MTNPEGIVPPGVAAELKRLGFGVPCLHRYKHTREGAKYGKGRNGEVRNWGNGGHTSAPTNAVAMEWLECRAKTMFNKHLEAWDLFSKIIRGNEL